MRICIFGAGAVGSHFAVRLALAGHEVSCVMRGPHLEAVRAKGLTLRVGEAEFLARLRASDDPAELGPQELVISTLKATSLASLVSGLPPLLRDDTAVVFAQNGIPWWYDIGLSPDHPPAPDLGFLDPGGRLRAIVSRERIFGGVIFSANEIAEPGVVVNNSPERNMLLVGECDDRASARIEGLRALLDDASIQSAKVARIREAIWSKLLTNMSMSVLCLLTGQTARAVRDDPALRDVVPRLLEEANAVATELLPGCQARHPRRPGARPQAFDPAGLRTRPRDGDRRAGSRAGGVRASRGIVDADARLDGGAGHPQGARQGAVSGLDGSSPLLPEH